MSYPTAVGGGWFELSDGSKVQGAEKAAVREEALSAGSPYGEIDCIVTRQWSGHEQYKCTECHWDRIVTEGRELEAAYAARDHGLTHRE